MNIKALIVGSFILMLASAVVGVAIYYSYLEPFRVLAEIKQPGPVLDKVTYIEYRGNKIGGGDYLVKVTNDPTTRSGKAELYVNGTLAYTFYYTYADYGLKSAYIEYPNNTRYEYQGGLVVEAEAAFLTGLDFVMDTQNFTLVKFEPFPGVAPVYLLPFIGHTLEIDWKVLGSITGGGMGQASPLVDVQFGTVTVNYKGEEVDTIIIYIPRSLANPPNQWGYASYTATVVVDNNLVVTTDWSVEVALPGQDIAYNFTLVDIQFSG